MAIRKGTLAAVVLLGFFGLVAIACVLDIFHPSYLTGGSREPRRSLQGGADDERPTVYPWARSNLRPLDVPPGRSRDAVLVWHITKSGGFAAKSVYECMGRRVANKIGVDPEYGHQDEDELVTFRPYPSVSKATFVNVDTTNKQGIDRAKRMGLVPSGLVDMIVTNDPGYAIQNLFDESHKGRVLVLFRHPVDRLVNKFFYLREATWEEQYRPNWKRIDVLEFAKNKNTDCNFMVKKLAGLTANDTATEDDLRIAERTIKKRFIVGLHDRMEESVHRFNLVMGIDESDEENRECMDHFLHDPPTKQTWGAVKVEPGSATWNALAETNELDVKLYEFVEYLFDEQEKIIQSYERSSAGLRQT